MPKDIPAEKAPTPRDPRIGVTDVAEGELLAVREFPGDPGWLFDERGDSAHRHLIWIAFKNRS